MNPNNTETIKSVQFGESLLGLYFAAGGVCARLTTLANLSGASTVTKPLLDLTKHFGKATVWGYENTVARFLGKKSNDPKWYQSLPRFSDPSILGTAAFEVGLGTTALQGFVSGFEDAILNKVQQQTMDSIFSLSAHKNRIVEAFTKSLEEQEKKIKIANNLVTTSVLSGEDFTNVPNKNIAAIARRLHGFSKEDAPYFNTIYTMLDRTSAVCSAMTSAFLVELDVLGRSFGSTLATTTMLYFPNASASISPVVIPGLLILTFTYNELNEFLYDYCWKWDKKLYLDTIFYPMISGIMNSVHEELTTVYPNTEKHLDDLKKHQNSDPDIIKTDAPLSPNTEKNNSDEKDLEAPTEPQNNTTNSIKTTSPLLPNTEKNNSDDYTVIKVTKKLLAIPTTIKEDWETCWKSANKYYAKYDADIKGEGLAEALQKNPTASKRLLSCRKAFLQILENCKEKKYTHGMMQIALHFRPTMLALQMFTSKTTFSITKNVADATISIGKFLGKHVHNLYKQQKGLPDNSQNNKDTQKNPLMPKNTTTNK